MRGIESVHGDLGRGLAGASTPVLDLARIPSPKKDKNYSSTKSTMNNWNMLSAQRRGTAWAREMADDMGGFQFMDNSTSSVINNLKFDVAKQVRSMIIILAGFNIAMALVLAVVIFRNCYKAAKRSDPSLRFRYFLFPCLVENSSCPANSELVHLYLTSWKPLKYFLSSYLSA